MDNFIFNNSFLRDFYSNVLKISPHAISKISLEYNIPIELCKELLTIGNLLVYGHAIEYVYLMFEEKYSRKYLHQISTLLKEMELHQHPISFPISLNKYPDNEIRLIVLLSNKYTLNREHLHKVVGENIPSDTVDLIVNVYNELINKTPVMNIASTYNIEFESIQLVNCLKNEI